MKKIPFILISILLTDSYFAQNLSSPSSSEILLGIEKLNTLGSVLYIAAHPDDENTRLLSYLAKEKKLRTGYLSITRGDGGQNLIGKEQGDALGLIRTQELLAARRIDGAEQFFTRANDFGYSKNPEETFAFWNKDSILSDMVFIIRQFKPDVIICRFPTTGEGGHGHHTASAILASEAFEAAADPTKFAWQLSTTTVWQCKALYWNTFNFGGTNTTSPNQRKLDVGLYNPLLGKSYGEIASESRSMHKSQGFGVPRQRGSNIEYFKFLKGDSGTTGIFDNVNVTWARLKGSTKIEKAIEACLKGFDYRSPDKSAPSLITIYKEIESLSNTDATTNYWRQQKLKDCETLLLQCSGIWLEAGAADVSVIPGQEVTLNAQVINRGNAKVELKSILFFNATDTLLQLPLKANEFYSFKHHQLLLSNTAFSQPFWLKNEHGIGRFVLDNTTLIGKAENENFPKITFNLTINGTPFSIEKPLVYKSTDPVKGEVYRPFEILPPASIQLSEKVYVFASNQPRSIFITVKANAPNVTGRIELELFGDWKAELKDNNFFLKNKGEEKTVEVILSPGKNQQAELSLNMKIGEMSYNQSIQRIEYDHMPYQFILKESKAKLVKIDLKKTDTLIGYIPGAGDEVAACLSQIGYQVSSLSDEQLAKSDLSKYTAIISGVRAFNTNNKLPLYHEKLMAYVKNGGNLIVQYNTNSRVGPLQTNIGPYPFTISRERVTDEKAEIRFTSANSSILQQPNLISTADFDNWVQERGIYFATDYDKNYQHLFSTNDPGEKENNGSLIYCAYGKGNFIYTGLAFFRQLPAGVPGAYRLLVNLISLPKNNP